MSALFLTPVSLHDGLNDSFIARHPPPNVGRAFIGYEFGNGRYVLERHPDIIASNIGSEPMFRAAITSMPCPSSTTATCPCAFALNRPNTWHHHIDKESPRIDILRGASMASIPVLLTGQRATARLSPATRWCSNWRREAQPVCASISRRRGRDYPSEGRNAGSRCRATRPGRPIVVDSRDFHGLGDVYVQAIVVPGDRTGAGRTSRPVQCSSADARARSPGLPPTSRAGPSLPENSPARALIRGRFCCSYLRQSRLSVRAVSPRGSL